MSVYEVECEVESAISTIYDSKENESVKRNLVWNVYEIQDCFDCKYTKLREFDKLVDLKYFQGYELEEYPLYEQYKEYLDKNKFKDKEFECIDIEEENDYVIWSGKYNKLFVEFGSESYSLFSDESPEYVSIYEIFLKAFNCSLIDWEIFEAMFFTAEDMLEDEYPKYSIQELKEKYFIKIKETLKQDGTLKELASLLKNSETEEYFSKSQLAFVDFLIEG